MTSRQQLDENALAARLRVGFEALAAEIGEPREAAMTRTPQPDGPMPVGRRARLLTTAAVMALVAVGGVLAWKVAGGDDTGERVLTTPATEADPDIESDVESQRPPPEGRSGPFLWLGASVVPPTGVDMPVVLMDLERDGRAGGGFGVEVLLERWDGARWIDGRDGSVCLDDWGCVGEIRAGQAVRAVGLLLDGIGPLSWVRLVDLDEGWYRLSTTSNDGVVAAGQFKVEPGAPELPPSDDGALRLAIDPPVRPATMSSTSASVTLTGAETIPVDGLEGGEVTIEMWTGTDWGDTDDGNSGSSIEPGEQGGWMLDLGTRSPGAYRVTVGLGDQRVSGRFWVADLSEQ